MMCTKLRLTPFPFIAVFLIAAMFTFIIGFVAGAYLSYITDNDSKDEK